MQNVLKILPLCFLIASCATGLSSKKAKTVTEEISAEAEAASIEEVFKKAEQKLSALVKEAEESGPEAMQYLATDLFLKGNDASLRGDSKTASFLFRFVHDLKPKDTFVMKKYAVELIRNGELEQSEGLLTQVFKEDQGKDEAIGLILGGLYTALEKPEKAKTVYKKVLKKNPKSEEACVFLSKAHALKEHYKSAMSQLKRCQKKMPKNAIFTYYMGKIDLTRDKTNAARKHFQRALKIDGSYYQAALGLGLIKEEEKDFVGASKVYKKFIKKNPENYTILNRLVQTYFAMEKFEEVLPYAEQLSQLDPTDVNMKVRLGILYTEAGQYEKAKYLLESILDFLPMNDKILFYLGTLYQQTQDFEKALETYSKIPQESPLFHDSHLQISVILQIEARKGLIQGDDSKVDRYVTSVEQTVTDHEQLVVPLYYQLAGFFDDIEKPDLAIEKLEAIRERKELDEHEMYFLASLYEKVRKFDKSTEVISSLIKANPDNAHALNFLGYSLLERGVDDARAFELISRAMELKPDDGYIRDSLGWYYYKKGEFNKALEQLQKAVEMVDNDAVITKHLAIVYQELRMYDKADEYLQEALKHCTAQAEREDVLEAIESLKQKRLPASEAQ